VESRLLKTVRKGSDDRCCCCRYPNEIIEFPCCLLQWRRKERAEVASDTSNSSPESADELEPEDGDEWTLERVDEFHSFVRPTWKPKLSAFCTELTAIQQVGLTY
jgi:3'-5' exoribonuclease 1